MPGVLVSVDTYDSGQILKKVTVQKSAKLKKCRKVQKGQKSAKNNKSRLKPDPNFKKTELNPDPI